MIIQDLKEYFNPYIKWYSNWEEGFFFFQFYVFIGVGEKERERENGREWALPPKVLSTNVQNGLDSQDPGTGNLIHVSYVGGIHYLTISYCLPGFALARNWNQEPDARI